LDTTEDRNISINCETFRELLAMKIKEMAVYRCRAMLYDRVKIQGGVQIESRVDDDGGINHEE
jgi:hypothetical protein